MVTELTEKSFTVSHHDKSICRVCHKAIRRNSIRWRIMRFVPIPDDDLHSIEFREEHIGCHETANKISNNN